MFHDQYQRVSEILIMIGLFLPNRNERIFLNDSDIGLSPVILKLIELVRFCFQNASLRSLTNRNSTDLSME